MKRERESIALPYCLVLRTLYETVLHLTVPWQRRHVFVDASAGYLSRSVGLIYTRILSPVSSCMPVRLAVDGARPISQQYIINLMCRACVAVRRCT